MAAVPQCLRVPQGARLLSIRRAHHAGELDVVDPPVKSAKGETDGVTRSEERVVLGRRCYGNTVDEERARGGCKRKLQLIPDQEEKRVEAEKIQQTNTQRVKRNREFANHANHVSTQL